MNKKDIVDAWAWIRKNNQAIPDDVLDLMKDAAIEKLSSHAPEVKGDWEIVSFIEKDEEVEEGDEPFILPVSTIPSCYKLEMYLAADSCFNIHSVKRTIDGEVFTLGDNCFHGPIVRFNLRDNQITADFECGDVGCSVLLSELSKPLQRTPDSIKPPIGIMPEYIWKEQRLYELNQAIIRYINAGLSYPKEWGFERENIINETKPKQ